MVPTPVVVRSPTAERLRSVRQGCTLATCAGPPLTVGVAIRIVGAALILIGAVPACGSNAVAVPDAGHGGAKCPSPPAVVAPEFVGNGIIEGAGVNALLCNVTGILYTQYYPDEFFLRLDNTNTDPVVEFQLPAGATAGTVEGLLAFSAPGGVSAPATYTSATSLCGTVNFGYQLPLAAEGACDAGTCAPLTLNFGYEATAAANCVGGTQNVMGSWALTVGGAAVDGGTSSVEYAAHGQLTAGLVGVGTGETATLALAF